MVVIDRRPPEGLDRRVRGGLDERDLDRGAPGGERLRDDAGGGGDDWSDVREALAALARPEARPGRALQELEILIALLERRLEIADGRPHAWTHDGRRRGGRGRKRLVLGDRAGRGDRTVLGHPGEHVAGRPTEV